MRRMNGACRVESTRSTSRFEFVVEIVRKNSRSDKTRKEMAVAKADPKRNAKSTLGVVCKGKQSRSVLMWRTPHGKVQKRSRGNNILVRKAAVRPVLQAGG